MTNELSDTAILVKRVEAGDGAALASLFASYRDRLERMVRLRMDGRLRGRIDPSDVLQDAFLEVSRRGAEYLANPTMAPFLWFRWVTSEKLLVLHRRHLGAQMRNAGREVSIHGGYPEATSAMLAAMLLGQLTSPTRAAYRSEMRLQIQDALNAMEAIDREIITLRHFEELSNSETAQVLGLSKTAASNRYIRALRRLKDALAGPNGSLDI